MSEADMRREIVAAVGDLEDLGMNHGSSGNVSLRCDGGILITPTGARRATLSPGDVVHIDLDGRPVGTSKGYPSSEWRLHAELHRHRPEIKAVIHTHADHCVALSCLRKPIPAFHYMIAGFGGNDVPCTRYEPFGSDALADAVVEASVGHWGCLLASHGMVTLGRSMAHAMDLAVKMETLARQYILACRAGTPVLLNETEMTEAHRRYGYYGTGKMPR